MRSKPIAIPNPGWSRGRPRPLFGRRARTSRDLRSPEVAPLAAHSSTPPRRYDLPLMVEPLEGVPASAAEFLGSWVNLPAHGFGFARLLG